MIGKFVESDRRYELKSSMDNSRRSGIIAIQATDSRKLFSYLTDKSFAVSFREGAVRVSPHFYNSPDEIKSLIQSLKRFNE